ncbi:TetR/AcrR family transcriptional regulator [Roseomonas sp. NAR14]|uniref:TetR/AcrR family transcriptional regulator n=1 Tax=Roseomonas acroporae TaxID=2937791 RepID=A0A9X1Y4W4_9PROT|nr:TetR/AcrR family transcriptional regulator [Roseomonas acroporae]MCK8784279.1 TetR/AcrR family transcriptional regulator [Roseomonas acroporae]
MDSANRAEAAAYRTRAESQAATRERLLAAAARLIVTESIPGLSLRRLCVEAGFTQGAFYSNFAGKEALLLEVMERHLAAQQADLAAVAASLRDADAERSFATLAGWLRDLGARREWATLALELRLHAQRDPAFAARLRVAEARVTAGFAGLLEGLADRLGLRPALPATTLAETLLGLWYAVVLRDGGDAMPEAVFVAVLRRMLEPAAG